MRHYIPLLFAVLFACAGTSSTINTIAAGAELVACVDDGIEGGLSIDQIIAKCGPDAKPIIEQRRALAAKRRTPCTYVTVDAGPVTGPGR